MPTNSTAQHTHRTLTHPFTSHYLNTTQRPTAHSPATPSHTHTPHLRDPTPSTGPHTQRRTHGLWQPQIPWHRAGPGTSGAGQAPGAPRPRPQRRHPPNPRAPVPSPHDPPSTSPLRPTRETTDNLNYPQPVPYSRARRYPSNANAEPRGPLPPTTEPKRHDPSPGDPQNPLAPTSGVPGTAD